MKKKLDWADKKAAKLYRDIYSLYDEEQGLRATAKTIRASEAKGFMRAVKMLREHGAKYGFKGWGHVANWLEENR